MTQLRVFEFHVIAFSTADATSNRYRRVLLQDAKLRIVGKFDCAFDTLMRNTVKVQYQPHAATVPWIS